MIVVSDTSAISNLAAIEKLDILKCLYGSVVIPDAVYEAIFRGEFPPSSLKTSCNFNPI